jgi:hypothetical protein
MIELDLKKGGIFAEIKGAMKSLMPSTSSLLNAD